MTKTKVKAEANGTAIARRYLGGAYIHGVPARDLTVAEFRQYDAIIDEQELITGVQLYEPVLTLDFVPDDDPALEA
jgi:hypothetical protein